MFETKDRTMTGFDTLAPISRFSSSRFSINFSVSQYLHLSILEQTYFWESTNQPTYISMCICNYKSYVADMSNRWEVPTENVYKHKTVLKGRCIHCYTTSEELCRRKSYQWWKKKAQFLLELLSSLPLSFMVLSMPHINMNFFF